MQFKQSDLESWILLSKVSSAGFSGVNRLLEEVGSPEKIFTTPLEKLSQVSKIDKRIIDFIKNKIPKICLCKDYELIQKLGIKIITWKDPLYPRSLKSIFDPPFLLYLRGELKKEDEKAVAMVGTRRATNYGKIAARKLARELARSGITIVSGMARGIDTCAHEGALEEGGRTVAVLGCGVDVVYPPENRSLMEQIIKQGAVISEFSLGTEPLARNFPRRNRIISGLSMGVVVVEAPLKSGALITVDYALEQGREVFAVPGVITSPYSRGTNRLIKEGAKVVEDVYDILEELKIPFVQKKNKSLIDYQLSFKEKIVFDQLTSSPVHIDEIIEKSGLPVGEVADILMRLQLKGMVREIPGKFFFKEV
ncbi:DNA-protecting protein DprA [Candidatus Aerophobetes bacterium]|uniref:DNA-protecting protein DprA n=1 Tax=Aerophobetes bacterium TaxID=2030807 RepID=A0A662DDR3_UNCAE|nr:MAG: DNA-protecting protein DprA [Candidatus Aerophobetes bacterium]